MTDIIEGARALLAESAKYSSHPWSVRGTVHTIVWDARGLDVAEAATSEDAALIAATPRLLAALADECERLRAENAQHVDFRVSINEALPRPFGVTVLGAIAELRAENARLREAMPGDDVRDEINDASVMLHEDGGMPATLAWLARLEAVRKGGG